MRPLNAPPVKDALALRVYPVGGAARRRDFLRWCLGAGTSPATQGSGKQRVASLRPRDARMYDGASRAHPYRIKGL